MIRDITIGQYYPADSVLHKMDPRAKLVGTLVFIISVSAFLLNRSSDLRVSLYSIHFRDMQWQLYFWQR